MAFAFGTLLKAALTSKVARSAATMGARGAGIGVGAGVGLGVNPALGLGIAALSRKLDFRGQGRASGFAGPVAVPRRRSDRRSQQAAR